MPPRRKILPHAGIQRLVQLPSTVGKISIISCVTSSNKLCDHCANWLVTGTRLASLVYGELRFNERMQVMTGFSRISAENLTELTQRLSAAVNVHPASILPFVDAQETITAFLSYIGRTDNRLVVAGHASPEVEIAADRAGMAVQEAIGFSPFVGHADDALEAITSNSDIVYMANPNMVTGCNYSLRDIDRIAARIPEGKLIVDERFFDFYGISAVSLLETYTHVVVMRSLTAGFGLDADTSGYLIGSRGLISGFRDVFRTNTISKTLFRILTTTLASEDARTTRLTMIHDESLRVANRLTQLGVQNRITAADFILLRVADPTRVGNYLAKYGVAVTNLDGYPELKNYMRYRLQSPLSNDNLLDALRRMPKEHFHLTSIDKRAVLFRKPAGDDEIETEAASPGEAFERSRVRQADMVEI